MVNYKPSNLDSIFHALADKTRRGIIIELTKGAAAASDLAAPHQMSLPAISKHLKVLERANLISREIKGRTHTFTLDTTQLALAKSWIENQQSFWESSLENLEQFIKNNSGESND
ncbi:MAG: helix-turn-helix transcriptional regulator [Proteobacteria bacterium]|jgi:DNA-binding transcriptional ArsR family regulator|nr:helix-turn-helix transcriptional regulator [Pseudomonadota bacterium]